MAGKSTVMRATMAVALMGACGLFAPVAAAQLPFCGAFMLRTFSGDAPVQGRSSFMVEMDDMRCAHAPLLSRSDAVLRLHALKHGMPPSGHTLGAPPCASLH